VPTYAYACTGCGHRFEAVQSFTDASLTECPECAGRLRKLFSSVGIVFKGSGFYHTDSRKAATSSDKKETTSKGASPSSDGSKADSPSSTTGTTVAEKKAS
jgi:putative FmdB family regulatory protein